MKKLCTLAVVILVFTLILAYTYAIWEKYPRAQEPEGIRARLDILFFAVCIFILIVVLLAALIMLAYYIITQE